MGLRNSERLAAWLQADQEAQRAGRELFKRRRDPMLGGDQLTMAEHAEVSRLRARAASLYEEAMREFDEDVPREEPGND